MVDINEDGEFIIYPSHDERSFVENLYFLCKLADDIPKGQTFEEFYVEYKEDTFYNIMDDISSILKNFRIFITHSAESNFTSTNRRNKIGDTFTLICVKCRARITEEIVSGSQIVKSKCPYCGNKLKKLTDIYLTGIVCDLCEEEILKRDIFYEINLDEVFFDEQNSINTNYMESTLNICKKCKDNYFPDFYKVFGKIVKNNMNTLYKLRKNKKSKPI